MKDARIIISVLNYRTPELTVRCMQLLKKIKLFNSKIVAVDNASNDGCLYMLREVNSDTLVIESPSNGGYAAGHQLSVDYAMANGFDAIWILNPDLEVHPNALDALVSTWKKQGDAIYGSISLRSPNDDTIQFAGAHELKGDEEISEYNPFKGQSLQATFEAQQTRRVTAVEGFSLFVPLSIIKKHGFMDHRYFMYGEETIWCYDLRKKGVPVYVVPGSIVYHAGFGSLGEEGVSSPVATYYRMRNAIYWKRKHYGLSRWAVLRRKGGPLAFVKFFLKYILSDKERRDKNSKDFLENLAILHAFLGIKGRRVA